MRFSTVIPSALVGFASLSAAAPTKNLGDAKAVAELFDVPDMPSSADNLNKRAEDAANNEQNDEYFVNPASPAGQPQPGFGSGAGAGAPAPAPGFQRPGYTGPGYAPGAAPYPGFAKRDENSGEYFVNPQHGQPGYGQGYGRPGYAPGTAPYPEYAPGTAPYPEVIKRDENANDYFVPGPAAPATGSNGAGFGTPVLRH